MYFISRSNFSMLRLWYKTNRVGNMSFHAKKYKQACAHKYACTNKIRTCTHKHAIEHTRSLPKKAKCIYSLGEEV